MFGCHKEPPLPEYGSVADFSLLAQDGKPFARADLKGTPWVAAFMFTRCPTICPRITAQMAELQKRAQQEGIALRLVSFSVDPEHDTPAVLARYAAEHGADPSTWTFATGDLSAIKRTSEESFKLAFDPQQGADVDPAGVLHGSHLVLVDPRGVIRGYYASSDQATIERLLADAKRLSPAS